MYVLGINPGLHKHDAAAALIRDGRLVAMVEQERISRRKQAWGELAAPAIAACLEEAGIELGDVALAAIGWDERLYAASTGRAFDERELLELLFPPALFEPGARPPVRYVKHHLAHAASAFWTSGFDDAAILVVDARGEDCATTLATATRDEIQIVAQFGLSESLGNFYALAAEWAGLSYAGAGKLMGLAPYGRATEPMPLTATPAGYSFFGAARPAAADGYFHAQRDLLFAAFEKLYPFACGDGSNPLAYANFAASAQAALEQTVVRLAASLRGATPSRNLCLAGGVALNCAANARLAGSGGWENVFVPPFPHDAGASVGAALVAWKAAQPGTATPPRLPHAYWGRSYSDPQIESALRARVAYRRLGADALLEEVVRRLQADELVGWFQGRAEVGPRALGARSLLASPCRRAAAVRANQAKAREPWRPFGLSITHEAGPAFLELDQPAEFMLLTVPVRPEMRARVPAVVHVDGTTRPQTVRAEANPRFWQLLQRFGAATGVPGLLNTSLNGRGEPIVHTPEQAVHLLERGSVDCLAIGDYLATRLEPSGG